MEGKAKIVICISENKFEISGSEDFVSTQIENIKEIIEKSVTGEDQLETKKKKSIDESTQVNKPSQNTTSLDDNIYVQDDDDYINIICDIPGDTKAEQTLNVALLYANARKIQGQETANVEEIRTVCSNHGCLDKANFSSNIRNGDPKLYIDKGSGKSRTVKLNRPGEKKAQEIIKSIKQNGE